MKTKFSIRFRLMLVTMLILIFCCIGLTAMTNYSASKMASQIAEIVTPAASIDSPIDNPSSLNNTEGKADIITAEGYIQYQEGIVDAFYKNSYMYMLCIISLGGLFTYFISKKSLAPLTILNDKIKTSTIDNLTQKLELPNTNDELSEIAESFNRMTDCINEAFMFQKQFSANAAHELRTPLTILKTRVEVFQKKKQPTTKEYDQLLFDIKKQTTRLSDIVSSLLNLTNMDVIEEKERMYVSDMVDTILFDFSAVIEKENIRISTDFQNVEVYGNIDLLYQVFYNLIQNSIKYNTSNGAILISAEEQESYTIISIADTGIGIPENQRKNVFESFYRIDESHSHKIVGAGLGLSIVKNIIEKHDGTIHIEENTPQGSCFIIKLPLYT